MSGDLVIARVAGERFALPADAIQSVIELELVVPVPRAPNFVAGLTTLRSRTLTVIDTARSVGVRSETTRPRFALVIEQHGCGYALAVDAVEAVVSAEGPIEPMRVKLADGWMKAALGTVPSAEGTVLVLDLNLLIAGFALGDAA
jgi:purine-binding chemotaxis protein CheW